jgi:X-X-X-Leu-X-X-Gly heptad repeat protein
VEVPATTRLSLSVAAAQAVFAVSGIILVALLRKLSKPAETSSGDDELRSVVRKLRITVDKLSSGQDRLDSKVDQLGTGQDQLRTGQDQLCTEFRTGHGEHEELIQKLLSK